MPDYSIKARFEAARPPGDLMRWLTSTEGIAGWWSDQVAGSASSEGDRFSVRFPTTDVVFELVVTEMSANIVEWHIPESPPWWKGTTIRFEATESGEGGTSLLFTHSGFEPEDPIIPVINPAWIRFLDNLVEVAQTNEASPAVVN